jgi:hypothetical protein
LKNGDDKGIKVWLKIFVFIGFNFGKWVYFFLKPEEKVGGLEIALTFALPNETGM